MTAQRSSPAGFVPLRTRLMVLLAVGVFVFGVVNLVVVGRLAYRALDRSEERHLAFVARLLAGRVEKPLLQDDRVELDRLVHECVALDPDLAYVLVAGPDGEPVVHTFGGALPRWLPHRDAGNTSMAAVYRSADGRRFKEFSAPVLEGRLGVVRVGLDLGGLRAEIGRLLSAVAAMVLGLLVAGVAASRWVAHQVTRPVERIMSTLQDFRLDGPAVDATVGTRDELEILSREVTEVAGRLQELFRTEQARSRELARVERLAALGTLTAGLAHELNNPLAGIKNAAQRLEERAEDTDRVRRYAAVMLDAARRMERLLGDMLGFSRTARSKLEPVDLCESLHTAARLAAPRLKVVNGRLLVSCTTEEARAAADPDLLVQVLLNLILNAADAIQEARERLIEVRCRGPENGRLRLEIEDTGPGVPEELRERIFDPFFTTKGVGEGTGLGLATAFTAVREMGGQLRLEAGGRGALFVIELEEWTGGGEADHG